MIAFAWVVAQLLAPTGACIRSRYRHHQGEVRGRSRQRDDARPDRAHRRRRERRNESQTGGVLQHVELLHDGAVLASERFRPLRLGERYPVALRLFRPHDQRKEPLEVVVRYVPDDRRARGETATRQTTACKKSSKLRFRLAAKATDDATVILTGRVVFSVHADARVVPGQNRRAVAHRRSGRGRLRRAPSADRRPRPAGRIRSLTAGRAALATHEWVAVG